MQSVSQLGAIFLCTNAKKITARQPKIQPFLSSVTPIPFSVMCLLFLYVLYFILESSCKYGNEISGSVKGGEFLD
jgi:ribose/xylose/arabinose/galactoside ABC-type transport system permease subunit